MDRAVKRVFKNDDACKAEVTDLAAYGKKFNPFHLVDREPPGGKLSGSPTLQRIPTIPVPSFSSQLNALLRGCTASHRNIKESQRESRQHPYP